MLLPVNNRKPRCAKIINVWVIWYFRRHPVPSPQMFEPLLRTAAAVGVNLDISSSKALADSLDRAVVGFQPYGWDWLFLQTFKYLDQYWHSQSTSNSIFFHWYIGQWSILQQAHTNSCNTVHDTGWLWLTFLPTRLESEHSMSYISPCMSILCLAVIFLSFDSLCDFLCRTLDKISKLFLACRLCTFAVGSWLFLNFIIMD